ncbi:MAG: vWA domain-containing protein [Bacteroidia bacterium]
MRKFLFIIFVFLVSNSFAQKKSSKANDKNNNVKEIDVVFCLDLSASTNGLLEDLKENYWNLVNHSNMLKPTPRLMISLVGYARPSFGSKFYYIKVLAGLTDNYDSLYEAIDKLHVNVEKGDQFVGQALMTAVRETEWSKNKSAAKMIFLVGNGSVYTGPSNLEDACELAKSKGIVIHTAYCMNGMVEKEIKGWEKIAYLGNGTSSQITVNKRLPSSVNLTPKDLWKLSKSFNNSFVFYGDSGLVRYKMMTKVDSLAVYSVGGVLQSRLLYKALRPEEQITDWDLIAYSRSDNFNLYNVDRNTMPVDYSNTVGPDMLNIIKEKQIERDKITDEIKTVMADELDELKTNKIMKEDMSDEGLLNRVVIKAFVKTALNNGFWL